ncbi:MAG: hypothetical protein LR011_12925 [Verrucomicrobia bacterium]|nr:hypothetical protein [Verrucomicrobiota bacterium]
MSTPASIPLKNPESKKADEGQGDQTETQAFIGWGAGSGDSGVHGNEDIHNPGV